MALNDPPVRPIPRDTVFFLEYTYFDGGGLEFIRRYPAAHLESVYSDLRQFIGDSFFTARMAYSEWLNLAEYPDFEGWLNESDMSVFHTRAEVDVDAEVVDGCRTRYSNVFDGLAAVIYHSLSSKTLVGMQFAVDLFNYVMDFGLCHCNEPVEFLAVVQQLPEFGPTMLDRIDDRLPETTDLREWLRLDPFERAFVPLLPMLKVLREEMKRPSWTDNELAVRMFGIVYERYETALNDESR